MRLYDVNRRQLNLTIRIVCRAEGSLKIFISAPYWLINKTGMFRDCPSQPVALIMGIWIYLLSYLNGAKANRLLQQPKLLRLSCFHNMYLIIGKVFLLENGLILLSKLNFHKFSA
jgi:hypothetical protein